MMFLTEQIKAMKVSSEELAKIPPERYNKALECRKGLEVYTNALSAALDSAKAAGKANQFLSAETDEEGNFKMVAPPGAYRLLARGRAGFNDAVWTSGIYDIEVKSGAETAVKLGKPEKTCLTIER
jgi:hypothetical protein